MQHCGPARARTGALDICHPFASNDWVLWDLTDELGLAPNTLLSLFSYDGSSLCCARGIPWWGSMGLRLSGVWDWDRKRGDGWEGPSNWWAFTTLREVGACNWVAPWPVVGPFGRIGRELADKANRRRSLVMIEWSCYRNRSLTGLRLVRASWCWDRGRQNKRRR